MRDCTRKGRCMACTGHHSHKALIPTGSFASSIRAQAHGGRHAPDGAQAGSAPTSTGTTDSSSEPCLHDRSEGQGRSICRSAAAVEVALAASLGVFALTVRLQTWDLILAPWSPGGVMPLPYYCALLPCYCVLLQ